MKKNKWQPTSESDYDYRIYERNFSGRMTKARWKFLDRLCRKNTYSNPHCGHEYDCCGCMGHQGMSFEYKHNQVTITLSQSFNY